MKLKYLSAAAVLTVLLPFAASALSADEIQQQIQSLLAQISQLQQQLKQLQIPPVQPPPDIAPTPPICPTFTRTLAQGASGDDVTQLQQYLGVSPTGYFGPMTARAVAAVQADAGLSQVGIIGPATRAWFWDRCGGGWHRNFSASPNSGPAPLAVVFRATAIPNTSVGSYSIDFGDGTSGQMIAPCSMELGVGCSSDMSANHTYSSDGTYTATLYYQPSFVCNAPPGAACAQMMPARQTVGSVTIYVGGSTSNASISISSPRSGQSVSQGSTLGISWNSQNAPAGSVVGLWLIKTRPAGGVPLGCPDSNNPADFPCGATNLGLIAGGQPTSGTYSWVVPSAAQTAAGCVSGSTAFDCIKTYANYVSPCPVDSAGVCGSNITPGSYQIVAKLYTPANSCLGGLCWPNSAPTFLAAAYSGVFTIGGSTIENASFSASPTSGPAPLYVVFRTNIVNALDSYSIDFGDGTSGTWQNNCAYGYGACGLPTATHTYAVSGTYVAKLKNLHIQCLVAPCNPETVSAVTIQVGGSSGGGAPSISGLDAPTSLAVGQTGTWTVRLNTTNTGNLSYSVVWGDEQWGATTGIGQSSASPSIAASGTFTHAYQNAGTYTPRFTVSNSSGSAQTSASVTVSGSFTQPCCKGTPVTMVWNLITGVIPGTIYVSFATTGLDDSNAKGAYVDWGDGTTNPMLCNMLVGFASSGTGEMGGTTGTQCQYGYQNLFNHNYALTAGQQYTYRVRIIGPQGEIVGKSLTIYDGMPKYYYLDATDSSTNQGYTIPTTITVAPTQVSSSNASPSVIYWCSTGSVGTIQSTPCSATR